MTQVLALDLGSTTGWATSRSGTLTASGTWTAKKSRFDGGGMRFLQFRHWLDELQKQTGGLVAVYFEEVRNHKGVDAAHVYGGFMATLTGWCEEHKVPYQGIPVGTIKRHSTGAGNAGKPAMIAAATACWKVTPKDDNEADALCILDYVRVELHKPVATPRVKVTYKGKAA